MLAGKLKIMASVIFLYCLMAAWPAAAELTVNPHGTYLRNTDLCASCHITHVAPGTNLIQRSTVTLLCYVCHDAGGQSRYNVAAEFGSGPPYQTSHHKIPEGTQTCTDCHNPHGNWPRLLELKTDTAIKNGNQFCLNCHQIAQGTKEAIIPTNYPATGIGHNKDTFQINGVTPFKPASGTGIACIGCHVPHGSTLSQLLKTNPNNDTAVVPANNKNQCYECHTNAATGNRYLGRQVFDNSAYSKHSLTASNNTRAAYPGVNGQEGQCVNCHNPHGTSYGTSKVAMKTLRSQYRNIISTTGTESYAADDFSFCFQCHNAGSSNNQYDIESQYREPQGGHRTKRIGNLAVGSPLPCEACHNIHGSANGNRYLLKDTLGTNLGDGRNECLACHTNGKVVEGLTMSLPPTTVPEHTEGTTRCLNCHGSPHKVSPGISNGGVNCQGCHSGITAAMTATAAGYHHVMTGSEPEYNPPSGRTCLSCHVDHDKFNRNKAANLRANFSGASPVGADTDFNGTDTTYGGLCLSCHKEARTKPDGLSVIGPINIDGFNKSAHNYNAASSFSDGTTFNANCAKCHNDTMAKEKQVSVNRFSTHNSGFSAMLSPFGDTALTNPMEEKFCFKCHSSTGDIYGQPMSAGAKDINRQFSLSGSTHDITGAETGSRLECVNCHGPHNVGKDSFSAGTAVSNLSDPDNTLRNFNRADGDISIWCMKCHDDSPPQAIRTATTYVPNTVKWPNAPITINGSGYNKGIFKSSVHGQVVALQCTDCHANHGSANYNLWIYGEDTVTYSGLCLRCHDGTNPAYPTAKNIKADLTKGINNSYRHPVLDVTAGSRHHNKENYQNRPLTERHAECSDCHDPHSSKRISATAPSVLGSSINISGVGVDWRTGQPNAVTWDNYETNPPTFTWKNAVTSQYEICVKCHSYFSYGTTPPGPGTSGGVLDPNSRTQTDPVKEFNPNNPSYHAVMGASKATPGFGDYIGADRNGNPWSSTSRMYCEDCHGTNNTAVGAPKGPHGSTNMFILKRPFVPATDEDAKTGTGSPGTDNHLCFLCHRRSTYGGGNTSDGLTKTGFRDSSKNLHNRHKDRSCNSCHSMVVHGSKLPHLLVETRDPYPYNNNAKNRFTPNNRIITDYPSLINAIQSKSGNWQENDCNNHSGLFPNDPGLGCS
ncbi:MAG: cytochrome c3 family protein [Clostridia bacterium]|nr:cytochrome c3 family protein [Clostridia bacterium]